MSEKLKTDSNKSICKYHSYDVFPAKVFFDIRSTENFQLMRPKPSVSTEQLSELYMLVYDEFFEKLGNKDAVRYIEIRNELAILNGNKRKIKNILWIDWKTPLNLWNVPEVIEMRKERIADLNRTLDKPIDLEADSFSEMERVMNVEIGIIDDEMSILTSELKKMQEDTEEVVYNYYADIVQLEEAHGRTLDEKMMLPKYVELVKLAVKKSEAIKLKQMKNGK